VRAPAIRRPENPTADFTVVNKNTVSANPARKTTNPHEPNVTGFKPNAYTDTVKRRRLTLNMRFNHNGFFETLSENSTGSGEKVSVGVENLLETVRLTHEKRLCPEKGGGILLLFSRRLRNTRLDSSD